MPSPSFQMASVAADADARPGYRPEIDGLRAFAVVAVIINHFNSPLFPSGYLGVDIFFVISGYVITSSLRSRPSSGFGDFIAGFYERRIKRLVPALVVFVCLLSACICLFDPSPELSLKTGASSLFGMSNLYLLKQSTDYFAQSSELNVFTHTWSLGVEEQFYILFPFLVWLSGFGRGTVNSERNLFLVVAALSAASLVLFLNLYQDNQPAAYFLMPARFWELAAGCLVFIAFRRRAFLEILLRKIPPTLVIFLIVAVMFLPSSYATTSTLAVVALTSALIACLRQGTAAFDFFAHKRVVYLGLISYSLYLWHWGVLSISRWTIGIHWWSVPVQVVAMVGLAMCSYHWVETPLRRRAWFGVRWKTLLAGGGVLLAVAGGLMALLKLASPHMYLGVKSENNKFIEGDDWDHAQCALFYYGDSVVTDSLLRKTFPRCWLRSSRAAGYSGAQVRVFAYGNSYTQQLVPAYRAIQDNEKTFSFNIFTSQCPASAELIMTGPNGLACRQAFQEYLKWFLSRSKRGDILLIAESMSSYSYRAADSKLLSVYSRGGGYSPSESEIQGIHSRELSDLSDRLNRQGRRLIYVSGIPYLAAPPESCGQWFQFSASDSCGRFDPEGALVQDKPFKAILALSGGSISGIDIFKEFSSVSKGAGGRLHLLYFNRDHLNKEGVALVAPLIQRVLMANK